jgi:hypothetical protein
VGEECIFIQFLPVVNLRAPLVLVDLGRFQSEVVVSSEILFISDCMLASGTYGVVPFVALFGGERLRRR